MPYLTTSYELPFNATDTSREAAIRMVPHFEAQELRVLVCITGCGPNGATQVEMSYLLQLGRPSVAARCRALELKGAIIKNGMRRAGCAVYTVIEAQR